jgi:hypothetical protein
MVKQLRAYGYLIVIFLPYKSVKWQKRTWLISRSESYSHHLIAKMLYYTWLKGLLETNTLTHWAYLQIMKKMKCCEYGR